MQRRTRRAGCLRVARNLVLLALCLHGAGGTPAGANVFDADDRRPLTPEDRLEAVGLIACAGSTRRPTAALVEIDGMAPDRHFDLIVSVAHAFMGSDGRRLRNCDFLPGGRHEAAAPIAYVEAGTFDLPGRWSADWLVGVLTERLTTKREALRPLVLQESEVVAYRASGARFLLAGHNGEKGSLMVSEHCGPVPKRPSDLNFFDKAIFHHDCDMMPGWSGGPLIMEMNGHRYVIAVNATAINAITHHDGVPFNPRYNPNTAVRLDGSFLQAIRDLGRTGAPARSPDGALACRLAAVGAEPARPC